ncbi:iron chaperone [Mucilaginibacter pallidiroseus]|uniref:iron chaperone n=1 Tax=Mucilaginibacter pallidiroseus TaxID=2599295 RepID=UPI001C97B952|nr:DUF1801 domain-containing protein [Mucilaginibacter pallidiroseus]
MEKAENVDSYIAKFDQEIQVILQHVREAIKEAAPHATEIISYGMPAYRVNINIMYFAAAKTHLGLYPAGSAAINHFKEELAGYKTSKGAIQFHMIGPCPLN